MSVNGCPEKAGQAVQLEFYCTCSASNETLTVVSSYSFNFHATILLPVLLLTGSINPLSLNV